jgi:hypothetical protein
MCRSEDGLWWRYVKCETVITKETAVGSGHPWIHWDGKRANRPKAIIYLPLTDQGVFETLEGESLRYSKNLY